MTLYIAPSITATRYVNKSGYQHVFTLDFFRDVEELHAAGRNAIFSNEDMYEYTQHYEEMRSKAKLLASTLNPKFRVKVLVGHRFLYDGLSSWYNQEAKTAHAFRHWPGTLFPTMDDRLRMTPGQTQQLGIPFIPFNPDQDGDDMLLRVVGDILRAVKDERMHYSQRTANIYAEYFDGVLFLPSVNLPPQNAHLAEGVKVDPLVNFIFCDLLETPETCKAVRHGYLEPPPPDTTNPSKPFNYDMIAVEAIKQVSSQKSPRQSRIPERIREDECK